MGVGLSSAVEIEQPTDDKTPFWKLPGLQRDQLLAHELRESIDIERRDRTVFAMRRLGWAIHVSGTGKPETLNLRMPACGQDRLCAMHVDADGERRIGNGCRNEMQCSKVDYNRRPPFLQQ